MCLVYHGRDRDCRRGHGGCCRRLRGHVFGTVCLQSVFCVCVCVCVCVFFVFFLCFFLVLVCLYFYDETANEGIDAADLWLCCAGGVVGVFFVSQAASEAMERSRVEIQSLEQRLSEKSVELAKAWQLAQEQVRVCVCGVWCVC